MKVAYSAFLTGFAQISKVLVGIILLKMIAYYLGTAGLGALGNFMSLATIVSMLAGGGVTNGIIKYVAEYKIAPRKLLEFVNSSALYSGGASLLILLAGIAFSGTISLVIFGSEELRWLIILAAIVQLCCAFANLVIGIAGGLGEAGAVARIQIIGNIVGLPVAYLLLRLFNVTGGALGILAILGAQLFPAYAFFCRSRFKGVSFRWEINWLHIKGLSLYSAMIATSVVAFPVVEIIIRDRLIEYSGYHAAGIWQGAVKLSSAYLNFFGIFLAYYFIPLISSEKNRENVARYAYRALAIVAMLFSVGAIALYAGRNVFIPLLLSGNFADLRDLIAFQLIGDFFKALAYVFGYIAVAKASVKLYIGAEVLQSVGFWGLTIILGRYFSPLECVFFAYLINYFIYFIVAASIFWFWRKGWCVDLSLRTG